MRRLDKALAVVVAGVLILVGAATFPAEAAGFSGGGGHFSGGGGHFGGHSFRGNFHGQHFSHFRGGNFRHGGFRHHHFGSRVFIGGAFVGAPLWWWGAPYYYYPYGYSPSVVVQEPPEYVEGPAPVIAPSQGYWYYCESAQGYYPNVPSCPESWIPVPAQPR